MAIGASDALRRAADNARRAAENWARTTTVAVRVITYSGPVGLTGSSLVTDVITTLSPRPKVVAAGSAGSSAFGGGFASASAGGLVATEYVIGPVTLAYDGGGYDPDDVLPVGAVNKKTLITLSGGAFDGTEEFEVVPGSLDATRPHQFTFRVRRTRQA